MSVSLREDMAEAKECCWNCGLTTKPGSGRFVNRIASGDDFDTRKANGAKFPAGEYLCAECENEFDSPPPTGKMKTFSVMIIHDNGDEVWNCGEIEAIDEEEAEEKGMASFLDRILASANEIEVAE